MTLIDLAEETVSALKSVVANCDISKEQTQDLHAIVEKTIIQAMEEANKTHREATIICCGAEADIAHKIDWESKQKMKLLIANLSALR